MRFYTLEVNGSFIPAVSFDGGKTAYDINSMGVKCADMAEFLRRDAFEKLEALRNAPLPEDGKTDISQAKICAPVMHPDQDMVCLGINYSEHATEAAGFSESAFGGDRPYTIYFSKRVNRASATGDIIPAYEGLVDSLDYEAELGVVMGADVKDIRYEDAKKHVFGYTIVNDVSARNLQTRHKQWYIGKSLDGFTPMGPCIVTPDELGDPENLNIGSRVNGELRQSSNTSCMIQKISGAIAEISRGMTLKAGSIIATGTPAGVGMGFVPPRFLKKGDSVTCFIEGIGEITNTVG